MENRRRRRRSAFTPILLGFMLFFIFVSVICAMIIKYQENQKPVFNDISITEEITAKSFVWLNQINDFDLSYEQVRNIMGDISLTVELKPCKTKGKRQQEITEGSYQKCYNAAYDGITAAYKQAVAARLSKEGYEGQADPEMVESLMQETYGLSVQDYLKGCEDLVIIPSENQLLDKYNVEVDYE